MDNSAMETLVHVLSLRTIDAKIDSNRWELRSMVLGCHPDPIFGIQSDAMAVSGLSGMRYNPRAESPKVCQKAG